MTTQAQLPAAHVTTPSDAHPRLHGRWLGIARLAWIATTVFAVGTFVSGIPLRYSDLVTLSDLRVVIGYGQLVSSEVIRSNLAQVGLTTAFYATYDAILSIAFMLAFVVVAMIIFARKSDDGMALLVSLTLVTIGASYPNTTLALLGQPGLGEPAEHLLSSLTFSIAMVTFYLFPDGRFVPPWSKWLALVWVAFAAAILWLPGSQVEAGTVQYDAVIVEAVGAISTIVVFQIYRYRHVSTLKQRQQTKWVVFGVAAAFAGFLALSLPLAINPSFYAPGSSAELIANLANAIFLLLIPSSIGIAILRYRLYDIDLLINRTLVYVPLTAILAGLFAASITLSQRFFVALTGQSSDAATVLTTLIVVAAIDPLKNGLQHLVDRRFKQPRKKFGVLGEQVRAVLQVIDVKEITRRLLDDAMTTFDAESGAVYLRSDGQMQLVQQAGEWQDDAKLSVPLQADGQEVGMIALGARGNGAAYTSDDRASLQEIGTLVARAIALAERMDGVKL